MVKIVDAWSICSVRDGAPAEHAFTSALALNLVLRSRADSLLLKTVHDAYNSEGIMVRNALSQELKGFSATRTWADTPRRRP